MSTGMFTMMLTLGQVWGQDQGQGPAPSEESQAANPKPASMETMPSAEFLQYLANFQTAEGEFVDPLEFDDQAANENLNLTDEDHDQGGDPETRDDG